MQESDGGLGYWYESLARLIFTQDNLRQILGARGFSYPHEAGSAIGGPDDNEYVMLELHFNNQGMILERVKVDSQ